MLKYTTTQIVFSEIPEEITLAIELSNCPIHCPSCHSKYLWNDIGEELNIDILNKLIDSNPGITCICFMGGDNDTDSLLELVNFVKQNYLNLKTAWYSGRKEINLDKFCIFDYIKIGPYDENFGPINQNTTNQRLYKNENNIWVDITHKFWK